MKSSSAAAIGAALIIGVNNLEPNHYGTTAADLLSPEKDVRDYELISRLKGYEVQTLVNSGATRAKILSLLAKSAKSLKAGDYFLLTFSGYGGIISKFGATASKKFSPTWCLYDGQFLIAELQQALSSFQKGVNIFVVADSSSILNGMICQIRHDILGLADHHRALPTEISETVYLKNKDHYDSVYLSTRKPAPEIVANVIWLNACQVNQVAHETEYNGCLTAAIKHIWNGDAFRGNYADFLKEIIITQPAFQSPLIHTFGEANSALMQKSPFSI
ncbi:MAG: caspase family protein [Saprospiraceae bacterium]|nr:caspase family protein [Saprospiraceae bacterium]MCF8252644.1 caspase family protein [Saprospiraceae bacterium]MCF8282842.1 caspase family protein [Bacteroidales bacterium]MCF8314215.1 caspase family protein [Saprospiraceae bacterium]MCF8443031.1 caspase family protein [Saprospiraceae bacterium]